MPIPQQNPANSPRRLLRDVVFDKILSAVLDGTLVPGERLNDVELVKWLGVSRTPVREALVRLASYGLVEIEANRYTRVASLDADLYGEALEFLEGMHSMARERGIARATSDQRQSMANALGRVEEALQNHDPQGPRDFLDVQGELVLLAGNRLLSEAEAPLRMRVKFLSPHDTDAYPWRDLATRAAALKAEIASS